MIKIKVFKKKFYIESYFFAVCENEEDYFGFDLGGFVSSEIAWECCSKSVMYRIFDEKVISDIPEDIRIALEDPFIEIELKRKCIRQGNIPMGDV